jgi:hypothetical protein
VGAHGSSMLDFPRLFSDDQVPTPCTHVPSPQQLSTVSAPALLADSDDEDPIPHNLPFSAVAVCDSDDKALIPHCMLSCPPLQFSSLCLPRPANRWPWLMPSWVWLILNCFFVPPKHTCCAVKLYLTRHSCTYFRGICECNDYKNRA